jgi:hypothetical protein
MNRKHFMTRTLVFAFLATALAAPCARAGCSVETGDFDGDGGDDIKINGNGGTKQLLTLDIGAASSTISLDCNANNKLTDAGDVNAQPFPTGSVGSYIVQLGGGDIIAVNIPADMTGVAKTLQLTLGPGNNTVTINGGTATLHQSRLLIDVAGYTLIDKLTATLPGADASAVTLRTDLSLGNDEANFTLGGDLTNGSVVDVDAVPNIGNNVVRFTQPAGQTISNSTLNVTIEGSAQFDTLTTAFAGAISGTSRVLLAADLGAGNDKFTGTFDLATFAVNAGAETRFDVLGSGGDDVITVGRNATTGTGSAGLLDVHVDGGVGNDTIGVDFAGGFLVGSGVVGVRVSGGPSNDKINVALDSAAGATSPVFDVALSGSGNSDTITVAVNNNAASDTAANYGPAGMVLVDGSAGVDTCTISGISASHVHKRNCP